MFSKKRDTIREDRNDWTRGEERHFKMKLVKLRRLALGMGMLIILGGCSSGSKGTSPVEEKETVTLTVFDKNSGSKIFDDPVAKKIMEETGVTIELENPTGNPEEKQNLMLSEQNYPDIILIEQGEVLTRYIEAGALLPLDDLLEEKCPNVIKMYGDILQKSKYTDGHNYWLSNWYGEDTEPAAGVLMRKDYLADIVGEERAGSTEPFTQSEYMGILRSFKERHPEINGAESIALSIASDSNFTGSFASLKAMFGMKTYYEPGDGTLQYWARDPQYLESMLFLNELYNEGILDKEWVVNREETLRQKMCSGRVFSSFGAYWDVDGVNRELAAREGQEAQFYCYKVVADDLEEDQTTYSGRSSLGWDAIGITDHCRNIDAALRLIDYLASEEGQYLMLWGIEGEDWTMEDGKHVPDPEVLDELIRDFDVTSDKTGIRKWTWFVKNGNGSDGTPYDLVTKYEMSDTAQFANSAFDESDCWDIAEYSGLEPAGNTILGLQWQNVADIMRQDYARIINAQSREEAVRVYENMIEAMDNSGLKDCEEYITEQYQERLELWGQK